MAQRMDEARAKNPKADAALHVGAVRADLARS